MTCLMGIWESSELFQSCVLGGATTSGWRCSVSRYISVLVLWKSPKVSHKRQIYHLSSPLGASPGCWGMWSCWTEQRAEWGCLFHRKGTMGPPGWSFMVPQAHRGWGYLFVCLKSCLVCHQSFTPVAQFWWAGSMPCHCKKHTHGSR